MRDLEVLTRQAHAALRERAVSTGEKLVHTLTLFLPSLFCFALRLSEVMLCCAVLCCVALVCHI